MSKQYITEAGKKLIEQNINKLAIEISDIQEEKAIAYTASGDTWHDNPGFNALEQAEHRKVQELFQLKDIIKNAIFIDTSKRNTEYVHVGSIVECIRIEEVEDNVVESTEFWEIGGIGESEPKKKKLSYETPIASALMGLKPEEETESIQIGNKTVTFEVVRLYKSWSDTSEVI